MEKEFNLSEKRKSYYTQLILDLRRVFQKWECPLKFKIELEEEINIFREVMRDLDKEFIKRRNELDDLLITDLKLCTNEGARAYCIEQHKKRRDELAGKELVEEKE